jgi:hypothetical protein
MAAFPDGGQVVVRRGDTLVTLRSGAPLGRRRRAGGEVGRYGHSDPCNGAVLVWRGGTFVGSGPGPLYRRDTALHNLVTINGRGQMGDRCVWFPDFVEERMIPPEPVVTQRGQRVTLRCELAKAYLPHLGVVQHTRVIRIGADGSLEGSDEIVLRAPSDIAWHWHTWARVTRDDDKLHLRGPGCRAWLELTGVEGARVKYEPEHFVAAYPHAGRVGWVISTTRRARHTTFEWSLSFK